MSGALRLFTWSIRAEDAGKGVPTVAHAFRDTPGFVHQSVCEGERWTVTRVHAASGSICVVCREIVAGAAFRALEEIGDLEGGAS